MIRDDLAAGRLLAPLPFPLPLQSSYFLTWTRSAFDKAHCRQFHRWLVARGREQNEINTALLARANT
jgi:LysR family glycine cleavage system transcriptional activator